jgi:hypothetical protein
MLICPTANAGGASDMLNKKTENNVIKFLGINNIKKELILQ